MSWYKKHVNEEVLDYSKPIVAATAGEVLLLVPIHTPNTFSIVGWDWLDLHTGIYTTCKCWKNPQQAVNAYAALKPHNVDLCQLINAEVG